MGDIIREVVRDLVVVRTCVIFASYGQAAKEI